MSVSDKETGSNKSALVLSAGAVVVCALQLWVSLMHELDHEGANYFPVVLQVLLFIASVSMIAWAVYVNLRDAKRAERLKSEIVSIKNEHKIQISTLKMDHATQIVAAKAHQFMPPWGAPENEKAYKESVGEQNRLLEIGRSVDGILNSEQIKILRLRQSIVDWFLNLPDMPVMDPSGIEASNADRITRAHNRRLHDWSERIRHAYAIDFAPKVLEVVHKLGLGGLDVSSLEAKSSSVENPDQAFEIIMELGELALQAVGRVDKSR